jgi:hypothetical protein
VLSAETWLLNSAADYAVKPDWRPLTKFENRGLKLGHGVWDLLFNRRVDAPDLAQASFPDLGAELARATAPVNPPR